MAVQKLNITKGICDCLYQLTRDFLIQPLLTAGHPFFYVHIGFRVLRIAIRPNLNNNYNITGITTLHLGQLKRISGCQYILYLLTKSTSQHISVTLLSLFQCTLV